MDFTRFSTDAFLLFQDPIQDPTLKLGSTHFSSLHSLVSRGCTQASMAVVCPYSLQNDDSGIVKLAFCRSEARVPMLAKKTNWSLVSSSDSFSLVLKFLSWN